VLRGTTEGGEGDEEVKNGYGGKKNMTYRNIVSYEETLNNRNGQIDIGFQLLQRFGLVLRGTDDVTNVAEMEDI
jgi:hypothetical protein